MECTPKKNLKKHNKNVTKKGCWKPQKRTRSFQGNKSKKICPTHSLNELALQSIWIAYINVEKLIGH